MAFTIDEPTIPASLDGGGTEVDDFREMTTLRNIVEAEVFGNFDLAYEAEELLPGWNDPYSPQHLWLARVDGRIAGRGVYEVEIAEGATAAWVSVEVLPEFRRRGIGTALHERLVEHARHDGRTVMQSYALGAYPTDEPRLESPTGFGAVPADSPGATFLLRLGYRLEQVERYSRLDLPVDTVELARLRDIADRAAGDTYRLVGWEGATPEEWRTDIATLHQRMSTDAPSAGLATEEDPWDDARVIAMDDRNATSPRLSLVTAVEHVPSGHLAGYTELSLPPQISRPVSQHDTLVLREHRGHRLGMLLKLGGIAALQERHAGHPSITTFNAEENRHMLSVNEAVGFVPVGAEGAWKREV